MKKLLTEIMSFVIVFLISIVGVLLVIYFTDPIIERSLNSVAIQEAIKNMKDFEETLNSILEEAPGSRRSIIIRISRGIFFLRNNTINYILESSNIPLSDFLEIKENLIIQKNRNFFLIKLWLNNTILLGEFYLGYGTHKVCMINEKSAIRLFVC